MIGNAICQLADKTDSLASPIQANIGPNKSKNYKVFDIKLKT